MRAQSKPTTKPISPDLAGRVAGARWAWRRAHEEQVQRLIAAPDGLVDTIASQPHGKGAVMLARLIEPDAAMTDEDAFKLWGGELAPDTSELAIADPAFAAAFAFGALAVLDPAPDRLEMDWDA